MYMAKKSVKTPGAALKALMEEYGLSSRKLAEDIKQSQPTVFNLSCDKGGVSLQMAMRLSRYFGTTLEYWLDLQMECDKARLASDAKFQAELKTIGKVKKEIVVLAGAKKPARKVAGRKTPAKKARNKAAKPLA
jgi:addiction module HigA family antidote